VCLSWIYGNELDGRGQRLLGHSALLVDMVTDLLHSP